MKWLEKKPALPVAAAFALGIVAANNLHLPIFLSSITGAALSILALFCYVKNWRRIISLVILAFAAIVGALHYQLKTSSFPSTMIHQFADLPYIVAVEGVVCKPVEARKESRVTQIDVDSVWVFSNRYSASGRCLLRLFEPVSNIQYGDRIVVRGQLRLPPDARNPGEFNYRNYLAAQDIHAVMSVNSANHVLVLNRDEGAFALREIVYPVRKFIIKFIDSTMSGQQAALLKALLVGSRGDIDAEMRQDFADVGVIHVLAVSGLHVGFILMGLLGFFRLFRIPEILRTLLVIAGLLFYAYLTGLSPSVTRATIMAVVIVFGTYLQRRSDVLNSLAVAAIIILAIQPLDLFQPGFQLSFSAVAGIVLIYNRLTAILHPLLQKSYKVGFGFLRGVITLFLVSFAAQVATLPLTVYYFGRMPLVSLGANLIVVPLVAIIVGLGLVSILAAAVSFSIGAIFSNTVWLLLTGLIKFVSAAASVPFAYVAMARPSPWLIVFYVLLLLLFLVWRQSRQRKIVIVVFLLLLNGVVWTHLAPPVKELKITFFDVGQGDAALLEFPNGKVMLIDAGDRTDYVDMGERVILPYLQRNGIEKIDCLVLTHAHSDHIGGAAFLMQHRNIGRIVESGCPYVSEFSTEIDSLAKKMCLKVKVVAAGDTILLDDKAFISVLHPTTRFVEHAAENPADLNNSSIVLKVDYKGHSILFAGDAEIEAESSMLRFGDLLKSDVLKVGHHGSKTASSLEFRHAVLPATAVVSVAKFNRFGLPSDSLLASYAEEGVRVLKTSDVGAVQIVVNEKGIVPL